VYNIIYNKLVTCTQNPTEKYQPFEVEISKLSGDPGKVMLKDHGFNVFVPDELKRLRVHHKRCVSIYCIFYTILYSL